MRNERPLIAWPKQGPTRAPYRVMNHPEVYAFEEARIFQGPTWNDFCLDGDGASFEERVAAQESRRIDALYVIPL